VVRLSASFDEAASFPILAPPSNFQLSRTTLNFPDFRGWLGELGVRFEKSIPPIWLKIGTSALYPAHIPWSKFQLNRSRWISVFTSHFEKSTSPIWLKIGNWGQLTSLTWCSKFQLNRTRWNFCFYHWLLEVTLSDLAENWNMGSLHLSQVMFQFSAQSDKVRFRFYHWLSLCKPRTWRPPRGPFWLNFGQEHVDTFLHTSPGRHLSGREAHSGVFINSTLLSVVRLSSSFDEAASFPTLAPPSNFQLNRTTNVCMLAMFVMSCSPCKFCWKLEIQLISPVRYSLPKFRSNGEENFHVRRVMRVKIGLLLVISTWNLEGGIGKPSPTHPLGDLWAAGKHIQG